MPYSNYASKRLPFPLGKGSLFLLAALIIAFSGCDSKGLVLHDFINTGEKTLLLSGSMGKKEAFFTVKDGKLYRAPIDKEVIKSFGPVVKLKKLTKETCGIITKTKGIFIIPLNRHVTESDIVHLPVSKDTISNSKIEDIYYYEHKGARKIFVLYSIQESGITEITLGDGWQPASYIHYDENSSELKSNRIKALEIDPLGYVWVVYDYKAKKGVSRLSASGEWMHYDSNNSELPDKYVNKILAEEIGTGLNRENVWFGSPSGLTRMQYRPEKKHIEDREKWKLYGERNNARGILARGMGIRKYYSDSVFDILDLAVIDRFVIIANPIAVYTFNGKTTNRFIPEVLEKDKSEGARIYDILVRDYFVVVKVIPKDDGIGAITSFMMLDLHMRKWHEFNLWKIYKKFPLKIYCIPYSAGLDFVVVQFSEDNFAFSYLDYQKKTLTPAEVPAYKNLNDIPEYPYTETVAPLSENPDSIKPSENSKEVPGEATDDIDDEKTEKPSKAAETK